MTDHDNPVMIDWAYSSSSAAHHHCTDYIVPQQENPFRVDVGGMRAPHRLRRQADTPRTPRDDHREALRLLLEGATEQVWNESSSHFEPRAIQCDEAMKVLQLSVALGDDGKPEKSLHASGISDVLVGEQAMAVAHKEVPASASGTSLSSENVVVVCISFSGTAPTYVIIMASGTAQQAKLKSSIDALAIRALPEEIEQNQAAMKIQAQVRNKELRNAVKSPNRVMGHLDMPGLHTDVYEPDLKTLHLKAAFDGGGQSMSIDVAVCNSSEPSVIDAVTAACTAADISRVDKMRMGVAVREVLEMREMCHDAPTTGPMLQALFSDTLVKESSVDECHKSLTDVEGQLKGAGFLVRGQRRAAGGTDKVCAAALAQALQLDASLELKYQQMRKDLLDKGEKAEALSSMVEQAGAEMLVREEAAKARQKQMDADDTDTNSPGSPQATSPHESKSAKKPHDTPRSQADSDADSIASNKYDSRKNSNACEMCEKCVVM